MLRVHTYLVGAEVHFGIQLFGGVVRGAVRGESHVYQTGVLWSAGDGEDVDVFD